MNSTDETECMMMGGLTLEDQASTSAETEPSCSSDMNWDVSGWTLDHWGLNKLYVYAPIQERDIVNKVTSSGSWMIEFEFKSKLADVSWVPNVKMVHVHSHVRFGTGVSMRGFFKGIPRVVFFRATSDPNASDDRIRTDIMDLANCGASKIEVYDVDPRFIPEFAKVASVIKCTVDACDFKKTVEIAETVDVESMCIDLDTLLCGRYEADALMKWVREREGKLYTVESADDVMDYYAYACW